MAEKISQIERRKIEAGVLHSLFQELSGELGRERALELIGRAVCAEARRAGKALAESHGSPSLEAFAGVLKAWREGNALEIEDIQLDDSSLSFRVTRCGYMEAYQAMGIPLDLGFNLSCIRDGELATGYWDRLGLDRPETISRGAPACLFRFFLKNKEVKG